MTTGEGYLIKAFASAATASVQLPGRDRNSYPSAQRLGRARECSAGPRHQGHRCMDGVPATTGRDNIVLASDYAWQAYAI